MRERDRWNGKREREREREKDNKELYATTRAWVNNGKMEMNNGRLLR
jgi:hypothetical protein